MGKGANGTLAANAKTGQTNSNTLFTQGQTIGSSLVPQLDAEAANPQGYTPQQMAYMNTASQQSLGGSTGGVTGQANLQAARTRNAGSFQGAIGSNARSNARQLSQNAVGIQQQQANLQQQQRQQALSALQSLYGVDEQTALGYLNGSTSAATSEKNGPNWESKFDDFTKGISNLSSAAAGGVAANNAAGCWIAAAVYDGWEDPRTIDVRHWLNTEFTKTLRGKLVMAAYLAIGEQVAYFVKRSTLLKKVFRPLFDRALARARGN
jgi:hypothetical protein